MAEQRCENCRFWQLTGEARGQCRRYAPRSERTREGSRCTTIWPFTQGNDWCGEHQSTSKDDPLRSIAEGAFYIEHIAGYLCDIRDGGIG